MHPYVGQLKSVYDVSRLLSSYSTVVLNESRKKKVEMDLSQVTFVSPIGAVSLLLLMNKMVKISKLKVHPPISKEDIVSYMERIDFFKHCNSIIVNQFEEEYDLNALANRHRNNRSKVLLEITPINGENDVHNIFDSSLHILKSHGMKSRNANKIANIISELVTNIVDHSEGMGYGAIQYYPAHNKVLIAIADNGIGIVNSLRKHIPKMKKLSDLEVIEKAFLQGVSSKKMKRGLGLTDVREKAYLDTKGASFLMRTHKSIYQITDGGIIEHSEGFYFPGSYIQIEIEF
ncbi:ATP-binding protein [Bacillus toyonensis]|uniref:ATP-binding protein n=1 Tax=Bacillus toyonensis TaxID=155322 RepID=UPI0034660A24